MGLALLRPGAIRSPGCSTATSKPAAKGLLHPWSAVPANTGELPAAPSLSHAEHHCSARRDRGPQRRLLSAASVHPSVEPVPVVGGN